MSTLLLTFYNLLRRKGGTQTECDIIDNGLQKLKMNLDVRIRLEGSLGVKESFFLNCIQANRSKFFFTVKKVSRFPIPSRDVT